MTLSSHNPSIYDDMVQKRGRWSVLLNHVMQLLVTWGFCRSNITILVMFQEHLSKEARDLLGSGNYIIETGGTFYDNQRRGYRWVDTWHVTRVSPVSNYLCIPASPTPTTLPPRSTGGPWTTSGTSQISSRRDCTTFIGASWGTGEAESEHLHFVDIVC